MTIGQLLRCGATLDPVDADGQTAGTILLVSEPQAWCVRVCVRVLRERDERYAWCGMSDRVGVRDRVRVCACVRVCVCACVCV